MLGVGLHMNSQFYFINAFTKEKFKGNPAAIVFLREKRSEEWMKSLAKDLINLSQLLFQRLS
jgi:predicted PhzF superfamily epimerase YddE/YHI9